MRADPPRVPRTRDLAGLALLVALASACRPVGESSTTPAPADASEPAKADRETELEGVEVPILPPTMTGTFLPAGEAPSGRVLMVSSGMLALLACADCGVPSYIALERIACTDDRNCGLMGVECRGTIALTEAGDLELSVARIGESEFGCGEFGGRFIRGEVVGTTGAVKAVDDTQAGQVVVGAIRSPREVDIAKARSTADQAVEDLDACFGQALEITPELAGDLTLEVVHGSRAKEKPLPRVTDSSFVPPTELVSCLQGVISTWDLTLADDGLPAPVYYNLSFVPR